jgi:pilus assembly protein Flp/PilA
MRKLMMVLRDEEGLAMVEYALIAGLIGAALIVTLILMTSEIGDMFNFLVNVLENAQT